MPILKNKQMVKNDASGFDIPIILIIFNREDTVKKIIKILRPLAPKFLYIIADGPRVNHPEDRILCLKARNVIREINWPCQIHKRFSNVNLGCGYNPFLGMDWAFSKIDKAIILEDDCLPEPSFFMFCKELLLKYENDHRIMMISGNNHLLDKSVSRDSYFFSINTQTHGWATWRRAWKKYDFFMKDWPSIKKGGLIAKLLSNHSYARFWEKTYDYVYNEANGNPKCSFWDYQWTYASWKNNGLNIIPSINLVTNIGYGNNATHQHDRNHILANLKTLPIKFPLRHPKFVIQNTKADLILKENVYSHRSFLKKAFIKIRFYFLSFTLR